MYKIIASDDTENELGFSSVAPVAKMVADTPAQLWHVRANEGKIYSIKEFPVERLQSFYAYANGMISCKIDCKGYIIKEIDKVAHN